jgi:glucose/arabinose dehydrogenase
LPSCCEWTSALLKTVLGDTPGGSPTAPCYKTETPPGRRGFPEVEQIAHAADLGLSFYTGDMFPAKCKGAILSIQHGSWNHTVPVGARVMVTF